MRYGDAKQIAQTLNDIFLRGAAGSTTDSATNEIAPGSGATALTTTERLTGGKPTASSDSNGAAATVVASANGKGPAGSQFGAMPTTAAFATPTQRRTQRRGSCPGSESPRTSQTTRLSSTPTRRDYRIIERTLNQLDRPNLQVAIEVTIAEVTLNEQLDYGVQFFLSNGAFPTR